MGLLFIAKEISERHRNARHSSSKKCLIGWEKALGGHSIP